jgi:hypothetical protein
MWASLISSPKAPTALGDRDARTLRDVKLHVFERKRIVEKLVKLRATQESISNDIDKAIAKSSEKDIARYREQLLDVDARIFEWDHIMKYEMRPLGEEDDDAFVALQEEGEIAIEAAFLADRKLRTHMKLHPDKFHTKFSEEDWQFAVQEWEDRLHRNWFERSGRDIVPWLSSDLARSANPELFQAIDNIPYLDRPVKIDTSTPEEINEALRIRELHGNALLYHTLTKWEKLHPNVSKYLQRTELKTIFEEIKAKAKQISEAKKGITEYEEEMHLGDIEEIVEARVSRVVVSAVQPEKSSWNPLSLLFGSSATQAEVKEVERKKFYIVRPAAFLRKRLMEQVGVASLASSSFKFNRAFYKFSKIGDKPFDPTFDAIVRTIADDPINAAVYRNLYFGDMMTSMRANFEMISQSIELLFEMEEAKVKAEIDEEGGKMIRALIGRRFLALGGMLTFAMDVANSYISDNLMYTDQAKQLKVLQRAAYIAQTIGDNYAKKMTEIAVHAQSLKIDWAPSKDTGGQAIENYSANLFELNNKLTMAFQDAVKRLDQLDITASSFSKIQFTSVEGISESEVNNKNSFFVLFNSPKYGFRNDEELTAQRNIMIQTAEGRPLTAQELLARADESIKESRRLEIARLARMEEIQKESALVNSENVRFPQLAEDDRKDWQKVMTGKMDQSYYVLLASRRRKLFREGELPQLREQVVLSPDELTQERKTAIAEKSQTISRHHRIIDEKRKAAAEKLKAEAEKRKAEAEKLTADAEKKRLQQLAPEEYTEDDLDARMKSLSIVEPASEGVTPILESPEAEMTPAGEATLAALPDVPGNNVLSATVPEERKVVVAETRRSVRLAELAK